MKVVPQNLDEFWVVTSRPPAQNGLGLTPAQTDTEIAQFTSWFAALPDDPRILPMWRQLFVQHQVIGKSAHDARLVAAMLVHGINRLLTFNSRRKLSIAGGLPSSSGVRCVTACGSSRSGGPEHTHCVIKAFYSAEQFCQSLLFFGGDDGEQQVALRLGRRSAAKGAMVDPEHRRRSHAMAVARRAGIDVVALIELPIEHDRRARIIGLPRQVAAPAGFIGQ